MEQTMIVRSRKTFTLRRRRVVADILKPRGDALIVTGLGSPSYDVAAAGDHPHNFYMWGGMGGAAMIGLGVAQGKPDRRVLVITGDGEMLMGLGSIATIGVQQPANLAIVVLDDEHYAETGMQETHTAHGFDLEAVAKAAQFKATATIHTTNEVLEWTRTLYEAPGPLFLTIKIAAEEVKRFVPLRDAVQIKNRFRAALFGDKVFD